MAQPAKDARIYCQQANPKKRNTKSWDRYERYKPAKTVREFYALNPGRAKADLKNDMELQYVRLLGENEPYPEVAAATPDDVADGGEQTPVARPQPPVDVRDRRDVVQPAALGCRRRDIIVLGHENTFDGSHTVGFGTLQWMEDGEVREQPMNVGCVVWVGPEPATCYAVAWAEQASAYEPLGASGAVTIKHTVFLRCLKIKQGRKQTLETTKSYRIAASRIIGFAEVENEIVPQMKAALQLPKFVDPVFAGLDRVADTINQFNAMGTMGVAHQAAESRRLTTRALEAGLKQLYTDPMALKGPRCVKTREFELKVAVLFEDWICEREPSISLSDHEFTSARGRFPADFLRYLRPAYHPTLTIPAPRLVREERREAAGARRARDASPRPLDRAAKKTTRSPLRWREIHIPKRLERHKEVVTMEELKDLAYWEGALEGKKKKGRSLGARAANGDFKSWHQGGRKRPLTKSVKHNPNAPPVEQIEEATKLRRESIRADTATARAEAAEAREAAAEARRASAEAELGKIKDALAKKALVALDVQ